MTMDRRSFMAAAAAMVAGCSRENEPAAASTTRSAPLGVQLYSVRDLMAEDVAATLDLVAAVGFEEVELAGYYDLAPSEWRRYLAASGLRPVSAHVGIAQFSDDVQRVIDHAADMGHDYLVIPIVPENERTLDAYRRHAADFNRWGEACAAAGIRFGYHNHMFEFDETDGQIPYDLLLAETDPELVIMELDFCWAVGAGVDPVAYFEAWPGRFPLCHLKDFATGADADIGTGRVDFDAALARSETAGLEHGFVERDWPEDSARSMRANYGEILPLWNRHMS